MLAVEDTYTTGDSVITAVQAPREASAIVVGVAVIVERSVKAKVESEGFKYLTAYQLSDLGL